MSSASKCQEQTKITRKLSPTAEMLFDQYGAILMNISQVADALGVASKTLRNYANTREASRVKPRIYATLPWIHVGGKRRFPVQDVAAWIDEHRSKSLSAVLANKPKKRGRPTKADQLAARAAAN